MVVVSSFGLTQKTRAKGELSEAKQKIKAVGQIECVLEYNKLKLVYLKPTGLPPLNIKSDSKAEKIPFLTYPRDGWQLAA